MYLNTRNNGLPGHRAFAFSRDGGSSFGPRQIDPNLPEPPLWGGCQGSLALFVSPADQGGRCVLFANPNWHEEVRKNMTLRFSRDDCRTWSAGKVLWPGPAAYSDLTVAHDGTILCLYERGPDHPYQSLTLARLDLDWLTDAEPSR